MAEKELVNKDALFEMFDFLHDVIVESVDGSPEWFTEFTKEFDRIKEAL